MTIRTIKVLELFGGIGAVRKALKRQQIPHEIVDYVEVDKNCVKSYNTLYGEYFKPNDIKDYHPKDVEVDLVIHGSPCQDFSRSGLKRGGEKGSGTRSSLLFETIRIIEEMKIRPKVILWENVKGVLDKNMRASFFHYLKELERLGYQNKYEVLNSMDFGIPQKRERIFIVSIYGENHFDFEKLEKSTTRDLSEFLERKVSILYEVRQPSMLSHLAGKAKNNGFKGRLKIIHDFVYTISTKQVRVPNSGLIDLHNGKYRYLTERECFRLMGFDDVDFNKLRAIYPQKENTTSSILYKQAGNSIVVNVLESILKQLQEVIYERQ